MCPCFTKTNLIRTLVKKREISRPSVKRAEKYLVYSDGCSHISKDIKRQQQHDFPIKRTEECASFFRTRMLTDSEERRFFTYIDFN